MEKPGTKYRQPSIEHVLDEDDLSSQSHLSTMEASLGHAENTEQFLNNLSERVGRAHNHTRALDENQSESSDTRPLLGQNDVPRRMRESGWEIESQRSEEARIAESKKEEESSLQRRGWNGFFGVPLGGLGAANGGHGDVSAGNGKGSSASGLFYTGKHVSKNNGKGEENMSNGIANTEAGGRAGRRRVAPRPLTRDELAELKPTTLERLQGLQEYISLWRNEVVAHRAHIDALDNHLEVVDAHMQEQHRISRYHSCALWTIGIVLLVGFSGIGYDLWNALELLGEKRY